MSDVFEPSSIGGISLMNRIIRSATVDSLADDEGRPTRQLIDFYLRLARGGAGAIITGMTGIQPNGKGSTYHSLMFHRDDFINAYRELTDVVHTCDTPIILQLNHCGRQTRRKSTGFPTVAPSAKRDLYYFERRPKKLSEWEIKDIIANFVAAIERAQRAGFDGVQLHCAHGFLLSEFLSSNMNTRGDRWGGSLENKYRIIGRILAEAKASVGDFPILAKINAYDARRRGMRTEEAVKVAKLLERDGCAAVEVSCGVASDGMITMRSRTFPTKAGLEYSYMLRRYPRFVKRLIEPFVPVVVQLATKPQKQLANYNVPAAEIIKRNVGIPIIVVGGIKRLNDVEEIIAGNKADYVSMSRPFICEPDIVKKFEAGTQTESKCTWCNFCIACVESIPLKCFRGKLDG
jgi:2,4-dienoyl-CoA reductase-like NADH-dependent reductase (Old Yellow Enzyme family)